jgi:Ca2+-binding EF-hand superfamily protein
MSFSCDGDGVTLYRIESFLTATCHLSSHPFDKEGSLTDDEIKDDIIQVGVDKDDHMKLMNEHVFDERINRLSDSCVDLMRRLMHPDPLKRMTSEAFLRHPWTQGLTASGTTLDKTHDELKGFWQNQFRAEILKKFAASLGISNDELSEQHLHDIFNVLDLKKNGVLERDEIQTTFRELGFSDKNIRTIFSCADLDGSGFISFDEFRALLLNKNANDGPGLQVGYLQQRFKSDVLKRFSTKAEKALTDKEKLREIYNAIDLDGNGILDMHDIRVVLRTVGEPETVISRIVESLDVKHDGRVSWDDFLNIMGMEDK